MTKRTTERVMPCAVVFVSTLLFFNGPTGHAAPNNASPNSQDPGNPKRVSYELGEDVFFHETFGGNGRTCATCHDPRNEFTVSPDLVRQRYRSDPSHPLFRPIDSDDGRGNDYTTLLDHALFRVTIPLHPNVTLVDARGQRTITVWRGVPSIANVDLTAPYLQDGRAATLQEQALGAIRDHMRPVRKPTAKELDALAAFEREFYYPLRLRSIDDASDPLPKEAGFSIPVSSPAAQRGKASFDLHCRRCHDGELGDRPSNAETSRFANAFVSDVNRLELPLLRLAFRQPDGTVVETVSPDPGRAAITGNLDDLNAFDTPSLRGLKHTAPYFHDNSAGTLEEVIEHYNDHFQFHMPSQERDDLIAFLEIL
jgi:cytochrome c peroxidase